jgi:hypothetical protein
MTNDPNSFDKNQFNSIIKGLEDSVQRSQILAVKVNHLNTLQTKQIGWTSQRHRKFSIWIFRTKSRQNG